MELSVLFENQNRVEVIASETRFSEFKSCLQHQGPTWLKIIMSYRVAEKMEIINTFITI